ncbi:MAG TPA: alpha/beta fold hydrolase [Longimicrobium sp.]
MAGIAVVGLASGAAAQGPGARLPGNYNGALDAGAIKLRLALSIERGANGALGGALTSVDQGGARVPIRVLPQGDTAVRIEASGAVFQARISANGDTLAGTWDQGGAKLPLTLVRGAAQAAAPARPQEPKRPFPYREEEVSFASVPGVRIAGTLTLPQGRGPFPAAVLITGSGQQDRDESLMGHKPFLVLSDYLTRRGIAVLRMDDRGEGGSTGDFGAATSADFANDVEAAVRFLAARREVARNKIGLIGHSEGGVIAPMVATRSRGVAYVVMLAGTGIPGDSLLRLQGSAVLRSSGATEEMVRRQGEVQGRIFAAARGARDSADAARRIRAALTPEERAASASLPDSIPAPMRPLVGPWFRYFLGYDPRPALRRLTVPTLALNGSLDVQVPPKENLAAIDSALRAAGNRDYRVQELPGLNHLFQTARTGSPSEYATIEETMSPAALEAVASWIVQRFVR